MTIDNGAPDESAFFSPDDDPTSEAAGADAQTSEADEAEYVEGDDDDNPAPELDEDGNPIETPDDETSENDESEEIEHAGKKFKIPKDLKPLLMMQQDYTRKTQEVAAERKAVEDYRAQTEAQVRHQAELVQQFTAEIAQIHTIDQRLAEYANVDWAAWKQKNWMEANDGYQEYQLLKDQRGQLTQSLSQKQIQARQEAEQRSREEQKAQETELSKRYEQTLDVLKAKVPGWNQEIAKKVSTFAIETLGYAPEDLKRAAADPRAMLLMHKAWRGDQLEAQQKAAAKKAKADIQPQGKPLTPVAKGRAAPATAGLDDRLSPEEWQRRRIEQLRNR